MKLNVKDIIETINTHAEEYEFFGLRADDYEYSIGDICHCSHEWWQDDPNGDLDKDDDEYMPYNSKMCCWDGGELDGTCAVQVTTDTVSEDIDRFISTYLPIASRAYLIAGDYARIGNDTDEIIISNATVIAIVEGGNVNEN